MMSLIAMRRVMRSAAAATAAATAAVVSHQGIVGCETSPGTTSLDARISASTDRAADAQLKGRSHAIKLEIVPPPAAALAERGHRQQLFMQWVQSIWPALAEAMQEAQSGKTAKIEALKEELAAKQEAVLFDALPGERRRYLLQFGCSAWTAEALRVCASFSPLIEIGAGAGHWRRALAVTPRVTEARETSVPLAQSVSTESAGNPVEVASEFVDIVAFDDGSEIPEAVRGIQDTGVARGGVDELRKAEHRERTLLLVYPGPDSMAAECLRVYKGSHLLYVGEGRGGYNCDSRFFDEVERNWRVKRVVELQPFSGGYEKLYVLKKRHSWIRGWLA